MRRENKMFIGLSTEICRTAWSMILPAVEAAAEQEITNKFAGCIVVFEPSARAEYINTGHVRPLFTDAIGTAAEVEKYTQIATMKGYVSLRTGMSSSRVQQEYPYLYYTGDTKWGGSTISPGGLVVAFSGVQAVFDEMISEWMASAIRALCRFEMTKPDGVMNQESAVIGR
jgi:hypothetical protein